MLQVVVHLLQAHELVTFGSSPRIVSASASHQQEVFRLVFLAGSWGSIVWWNSCTNPLSKAHFCDTPKVIDAAIDRNHDLIGNAVEFEKEECM